MSSCSFLGILVFCSFFHSRLAAEAFRRIPLVVLDAASSQHRWRLSAKTGERLETPAAVNSLQEIRELTKAAIEHRGTNLGLFALDRLGQICATRTPYCNENENRSGLDGSVLSMKPGLLAKEVAVKFLDQVKVMETNGWLSDNPDSVDGLPSLHLNLVSKGRPLFEGEPDDEFQQRIQNLLHTIEPYVYDELLPTVQAECDDPDIIVSDVFLRRYGQDITNAGASRNGISAHYDVFSKVTAVIAMDDTASDGKNGLYTSALTTDGATSNHAGLRRYFPLKQGDSVIHTWDILHGVDIQPGKDRTSLIVWFSTKGALLDSTDGSVDSKSVAPWLSDHADLRCNNVVQFVLGSALESANVEAATNESPLEWYLSSARGGNSFALTRLGSLCEDKTLSEAQQRRALDVLHSRAVEELPFGVRHNEQKSLLARRFWFEGSLCGNPLSQQALADDLMEEAVSEPGPSSYDLCLLAATLFGLAAQQGSESAADALERIVGLRVAADNIQTEEEFFAHPIVQVAQASMNHDSHDHEAEFRH